MRAQPAARRTFLRHLANAAVGVTGTALLAACGTAAGTAAASNSTQAGITSSVRATAVTQRTVGSATAAPTAAPPVAATVSATSSAPAPAAGPVVFWSNAGYPYKGHVGAQLAQEFEQAGGPTIAWTDTAYSDFMAKLLTTVAAGTPPDLSYIDRYVTQGYACRGVLSPLDDMIGRSTIIHKDMFFARFVQDTTYRGKTYAIPNGAGVGFLFYNKDALQAAGLDPAKPPTTWSDAQHVAQQLTRRQGSDYQQVGWSPAQDWGIPWMVPYWQQGGDLLNQDGTKVAFANAQAAAALDFLKSIYDLEGGYDAVSAFVASGGRNAQKTFFGGQLALHWDTFPTVATIAQQQLPFAWGFSYFPLPPGGAHANYGGGWGLVIPRGAKHAAGAFQYLEYLSTPDPQVRWAVEWASLPTVIAVAQSPAYLQGQADRELAVAELPNARFVVATPGGDQIISVESGVLKPVMSGQQTSKDALATAVQQAQGLLDTAYRSCTVR